MGSFKVIGFFSFQAPLYLKRYKVLKKSRVGIWGWEEGRRPLQKQTNKLRTENSYAALTRFVNIQGTFWGSDISTAWLWSAVQPYFSTWRVNQTSSTKFLHAKSNQSQFLCLVDQRAVRSRLSSLSCLRLWVRWAYPSLHLWTKMTPWASSGRYLRPVASPSSQQKHIIPTREEN